MISAAELAADLGIPAPTAEQAAVIEGPLAPGLVIAGAGSGKTETMAARVVYLVATGQVRPEQVLGLTFTRKAAAALSQRVRRRLRMLGGSDLVRLEAVDGVGGDPDIGTYHSFGGRLIADFGPLAGVEPAARVLTPTGAWQLARRVVGRWDGDLNTDLGPDQVTERLLAISGALADHLTDVDALSDALDHLLATLRSAPPTARQQSALHSALVGHVKRLQDRQWILPLVQAFTDAKREQGVIDYADQMQIAAGLVQRHPRIGVALRDKYRVVLLDEYQDTGHAQRVILRTLFGAGAIDAVPGHPVTAVGDPVQSIYSWRGASASNLPRFVTDFPQDDGAPATSTELLTSFRNPASVLALANDLSASIRSGPSAPVPVGELRTAPGAGPGEVRHGLFATVADEDAWLARSIAQRWREAMDSPAAAPPTTAVLLRRRSDMAATADALRAAGLPVEVVGLGGLLDEPEIGDLVATLRVLVDPTAGAAAIRLLTGARWRLGIADLEALAQRARELVRQSRPVSAPGRSGRDSVREAVAQALSGEDIDAWCLVDAISDPGPAQRYSPEGHRRLARCAAQLRRLRSRMGQPLPDLIADLERALGLDIEVQLGSPAGRAHLDAFADVVAEVAATGAGPKELLDYLDAAAEREDGLTPGEVPATSGTGPGADRACGQGPGVGTRRGAPSHRGGLPDHQGEHLARRCRTTAAGHPRRPGRTPDAVVATGRQPEGRCRRTGRACGRVRATATHRGTPAALRRAHQGRAGIAGVRTPLGRKHHETRRSQRLPAGGSRSRQELGAGRRVGTGSRSGRIESVDRSARGWRSGPSTRWVLGAPTYGRAPTWCSARWPGWLAAITTEPSTAETIRPVPCPDRRRPFPPPPT